MKLSVFVSANCTVIKNQTTGKVAPPGISSFDAWIRRPMYRDRVEANKKWNRELPRDPSYVALTVPSGLTRSTVVTLFHSSRLRIRFPEALDARLSVVADGAVTSVLSAAVCRTGSRPDLHLPFRSGGRNRPPFIELVVACPLDSAREHATRKIAAARVRRTPEDVPELSIRNRAFARADVHLDHPPSKVGRTRRFGPIKVRREATQAPGTMSTKTDVRGCGSEWY